MDPASILGLTGSIVSIVDVITRSISSLRALQERWKNADLTVSLLVVQLSTLKSALDQISQWMSTTFAQSPQHHQVVIDMSSSIRSCEALISFVDNHISRLDHNESNNLTFESRARVVLQDQSVRDCVNHLNNQAIAFNFLLTALNWYSARSISTSK